MRNREVETNRFAVEDSNNGLEQPSDRSREGRVQQPSQVDEAGVLSKARPRKGTGPRTKLGKQRSRYNAMKDGLYSSAALLSGESEAKYRRVIAGLRSAWQPHGPAEDSMVEYLGLLTWRLVRCLKAERAEITSHAEFAWLDWIVSCRSQRDEALRKALDNDGTDGMLHEISNPFVVLDCVNWLKAAHGDLECNGFSPGNEKLLARIYGRYHSFMIVYLRLSLAAQSASADSVYREEKKTEGLRLLDAEIEGLKVLAEDLFATARQRIEYSKEAGLVLPQGSREHIRRLESHLNREYERGVRKLQDLKAERLGQPVPPSIRPDCEDTWEGEREREYSRHPGNGPRVGDGDRRVRAAKRGRRARSVPR